MDCPKLSLIMASNAEFSSKMSCEFSVGEQKKSYHLTIQKIFSFATAAAKSEGRTALLGEDRFQLTKEFQLKIGPLTWSLADLRIGPSGDGRVRASPGSWSIHSN